MRVAQWLVLAMVLGLSSIPNEGGEAPNPMFCLCSPPQSPEEAFVAADRVYLGTVTNVQYLYENTPLHIVNGKTDNPLTDYVEEVLPDELLVSIRIERSWKGGEGSVAMVRSEYWPTACGYHFRVGERYLVYDYASKGRFYTYSCDRTRRNDDADEDLRFLNQFSGED